MFSDSFLMGHHQNALELLLMTIQVQYLVFYCLLNDSKFYVLISLPSLAFGWIAL